jgi:hypothetical protein
MAESFSCWYLTAEAWVCKLVDVGFVVDRGALGQANIIKVSCLNLIERTNKMQLCSIIVYSNVF